jgi:TonB-dependent receptor
MLFRRAMTGVLAILALLALANLIVPLACAQSGRGSISGQVSDTTGNVLVGAKIKIEPTDIVVVTDEGGSYLIAGLEPGEYQLTISYLAFKDFTATVTVKPGQISQLNAVMKVASQSEQIVVTAERPRGEAEALNRQENASNILQVLPAEVITSLPNANIADAVGRLPSVTLERDEGEGKYVQIRGTEPRLTNVTIDGINVPSPEAGVRQVKLDTIPADLVDSVEINKTLQADQDGDGIGGSVNLVTKTAGDLPTISILAGGGYTPIVNGRKVAETSGTVGQRFGAQKKLGILIGGHYDWNGRGIDDIEPVPDALPTKNGGLLPYYDSMDIREYAYYRTRWGFAGSADYRFREDSSIYIRGLYSDFKDYGDKWVYTINDNSNNPGLGAPNTPPANPGYSDSSRRPDFAIGSLVVGGRHVFSTKWFAWDLSVARSRQLDSGGDPGADFNYNGPNSTCLYDPALTAKVSAYRPQWTPNCYAEAFNQSNYSVQDLVLSHGKTAQLNLQASGAFAKRYHLGSHLSTIEIGGKIRNGHKFDDSYTLGYDPTVTLADTMFLSQFGNSDYYNGTYKFGPVVSYGKVLNYFKGHPKLFALEPYDPNGNTTIGGNPGNFDLVERISAGYVMHTTDFGRFHVIVGFRVEETMLDTTSFATMVDAAGDTTFGTKSASGSYLRLLPSASVRYALTANSGLRLVYGRGLSRPDPEDIAQAYSISTLPPKSVSLGNPNLKAEAANNYDLLYEHYLNPLGMFQAGFFYKQLYDPIVTKTIPAGLSTGQFAGFVVTQPVNAGSAWVTGFEVAFLKHLTFLPGAFGGLGISANYSRTASEADGLQPLGRSDHPALVRQAPNTWNVSPTYDRGRFSLRVGMTYNDRSIFAYQYTDGTGGTGPSPFGVKGPFGDTYLYPHLQLDAQGSVGLRNNVTMIVYGLNLNNEVFGFYNGSPQFVLQREYYGPTFGIAFRWDPQPEKK